MRRVYITTSDSLTMNMFLDKGWSIVVTPEDADLICFTGGADVSPFLYGERPHKTTHFSAYRDNNEIGIWKKMPPKLPKVGICRGAQLGNVLCGGSLWQNVDNHHGKHAAKDLTGVIHPSLIMLSSDHHQMCKLTSEAMIFTVAKKSFCKEGDVCVRETRNFNNWEDPEAFFYDNFNFLGVQFHPEWDGYPMAERCTNYFFQLMDLCFDFEDDDDELPAYSMSQVPTDERGIPILG